MQIPIIPEKQTCEIATNEHGPLRLERLPINVIYSALHNRWFGEGVDIWLQLLGSVKCVPADESGWWFLPFPKVIGFDQLGSVVLKTKASLNHYPLALEKHDFKQQAVIGPVAWSLDISGLQDKTHVVGALLRAIQ